MDMMLRRNEPGDTEALASAIPDVPTVLGPSGLSGPGVPYTRQSDGAPFLAHIHTDLTESIVDAFAKHPACEGLDIQWSPDFVSVVGFDRVQEEMT